MTTLHDESLIAMPDATGVAGAIVYWNLSGTTDAMLLARAWHEAGLPEEWLLDLPTPEIALRRAVHEQSEKHRLVRGLPNGGWAIVREHEREDDLDYDVQLKVKLSITGHLKFEGRSLDGEAGNAQRHMADEIRDAFSTHLDKLSRADIGAWLCELLPKLDAVALRGGGGVYFIPPTSMPRWESVKDAVREASATRLYEIPAMHAKVAVEAVLDAVTVEAQEAADALLAEVGTKDDPLLGSRAIQTRGQRLELVRQKLQRYESLLGIKLEELVGKLGDVQASIAAAAMVAHAREQQAEAAA